MTDGFEEKVNSYLAFRIAGNTALQTARFACDKNVLFWSSDESRMFGHFKLNTLPSLAERIRGNGFVYARVSVQHPVDE